VEVDVTGVDAFLAATGRDPAPVRTRVELRATAQSARQSCG